jgi:hypothetical protein
MGFEFLAKSVAREGALKTLLDIVACLIILPNFYRAIKQPAIIDRLNQVQRPTVYKCKAIYLYTGH